MDLKAAQVLGYAFFPNVTEACLLTSATSKGVPTSAPNNPLTEERKALSVFDAFDCLNF